MKRCTLALLAMASLFLCLGTAQAKQVKNVKVKNCSTEKVLLCWFNGGDGLKQSARKLWKIPAGETFTLQGKTNKNFAKIVALPSDRSCGEWNIFGTNLFKKARTGNSFVVTTNIKVKRTSTCPAN